MKHFLEISQLSVDQIKSLLARALEFKNKGQFLCYSEHPVAHLFYENSTRTRVSFELAANNLSMPVVNLDLHSSSEQKGEVIEDTVRTLAAMGIRTFVIRHQANGLQQNLADSLGDDIHIINAGDGTHAHPTQALLDMLTIIERNQNLDQLKVVVVGNIKHSRVASSFQAIAKQLGLGELVLVAPSLWQPERIAYGQVSDNLSDSLREADVVMCLRVQKERLQEHETLDLAVYRREFALTNEMLKKAKPDAVVMHPGPMNRGIEIDSDVADGPQSVILEQVRNGVFARMAILEALVCNL
jgi:aspartate carbamoyltransferase catalytic subunit